MLWLNHQMSLASTCELVKRHEVLQHRAVSMEGELTNLA